MTPFARRGTRIGSRPGGSTGSGPLRDETGSTLVETALVLPVVFLLTFGFIDICLILFSVCNANFACHYALRYATQHSATSYAPATQQTLTTLVGTYIPAFPTNTYSLTTRYNTTNAVGNIVYVTLNVSYTFNILGTTFVPILYNTTGCGVILQ